MRFALFLLLLATGLTGRSQTLAPKRTFAASAELGGFSATTGRMPFWLRANQFGTVPLTAPVATARLAFSTNYVANRRFSWGAALEGVANAVPAPDRVDRPASLLFPDAYVKVRYDSVELWVGNRRDVMGIVDTLLTSGSYSWSGNALPITRVQIGTRRFIPVRWFKHLLAFQWSYAHGWFPVTEHVQGSYLHQKSVHIRLGRPSWRTHLYGGLNHQAQWGGHLYGVDPRLSRDGALPSGLDDYFMMVIAVQPHQHESAQYTTFDGYNQFGNHVGTYDFGLEINWPSVKLLAYHQHIFEEASGLLFKNPPDGLSGLSLTNRRSDKSGRFSWTKLLVEFLYTRHQSGPVFSAYVKWPGAISYFNHAQYVDGWTYQNRVIGTPFITRGVDATQWQHAMDLTINNNVVMVWHLGGSGRWGQASWLVKTSLSRNYGLQMDRFYQPLTQFSGLLKVSLPVSWLSGSELTGSLATDIGQLYTSSTGLYIGLRKSWVPGRPVQVKR